MASLHITPEPSDEEVAAIMGAIEGAWPRAAAAADHGDATRWRWSGRWWSKPIPARRVRPW